MPGLRAALGRASLFLAAFVLGACASVPAPQPLAPLESVPASFEMSGRLAVRQGEHSEIARLRWTRMPHSDVWAIASPLGNEVARIESTERGARLTRAGGPTEEAPSFQALTQRLLGVGLDPSLLAAWLHGAAPASGPADWTFTLEETQQAGAVTLAKRLTASRGNVVVRLVVDSYRALGN
jgi:outer membrane biogenesis lipoprotein LolB